MMPGQTLEEIWKDDLFGRRQEAEAIIAFLESVAGRQFKRDDKQSYTIAIEAGYGEGKSFFLRRLAAQIGIDHPVAFVDAWADDISNEPFTALVATLESALGNIASEPNVEPKVVAFKKTAGRVLKIAGAGLLRRGAGILIGAAAVDALEGVISELGEAGEGAAEDKVPEMGTGMVDDFAKGLEGSGDSLMNRWIAEFRDGQRAVFEIKDNLSQLISALQDAEARPPVFIVIDELDRCRPTYAIKLLEEIKHLFDVPGLVFILALNSNQLSHSVAGAYGPDFDGKAYLSRFIDREYRLINPDALPLIRVLCQSAGLDRKRYFWEHVVLSKRADIDADLPKIISLYAIQYGLTPREIYKFIDILQTCESLVGNFGLHVAYLFPLIIGHIKGLNSGELASMVNNVGYCYTRRDKNNNWNEVDFSQAAHEFFHAIKMSIKELEDAIGNGTATNAMIQVRRMRPWDPEHMPLHAIDRYPQLIGTVARFSNPQI